MITLKKIDDICFIMQARLSSERTPRKMIKNFAGTSLVDIACKKVIKSTVIPKENFYFSAYEQEIVDVVKSNNLNIYYRSEKSAKSEGPMQEVMEYHDKLDYKYSIVISACCPLLKIQTIDSFINAYLNSPYDGLFSVVAKKNYFWNINGDLITEWPANADVLNTKLVGVTYEAAHCLYAGRLDCIKDGVWMAEAPFKKNAPALFEVPEEEILDIDYPWQFETAEKLYKSSNLF